MLTKSDENDDLSRELIQYREEISGAKGSVAKSGKNAFTPQVENKHEEDEVLTQSPQFRLPGTIHSNSGEIKQFEERNSDKLPQQLQENPDAKSSAPGAKSYESNILLKMHASHDCP